MEQGLSTRFDGVWTLPAKPGNKFILTIHGRTAEWFADFTNRVQQGKTWPAQILPAQYNKIPAISEKVTGSTTDVKPEGSNLRISWSPSSKRIIDWSPKTIPLAVLQASPLFGIKSGSELYTLNGTALIRINQNGTTATFFRAR